MKYEDQNKAISFMAHTRTINV